MAGAMVGADFFTDALEKGVQRLFTPPKPCLCLIIDDNGYCLSRTRLFLDLNLPITFSMLPHLPHTLDLAREIHDQGHEIMLHQPMEPVDPHFDPGPGALFTRHDKNRIHDIISQNIELLPMASGVNNHMGSRFTAKASKMKAALSVIKKRRLFFIDSLTSSRSTGYDCARKLGIPSAQRNVFLDNQKQEDAVYRQMRRLYQQALQHGIAAGIGHPFPQTAAGIRRFVRDHGASFTLSYASRIAGA